MQKHQHQLSKWRRQQLPKTFSATLLLLLLNTAFCQDLKTQQDFIVLYSGDTLYGAVEHINHKGVSPKFHRKIRLEEAGGKKQKIKRKVIAAFRSDGELYESIWLSQSSEKIQLVNPKYAIDVESGQQYFLKLINKGKLSHYHLEWLEQGQSSLLYMDLLKKENDPFLIRATQGLLGLKAKTLRNYFADCPDLQDQIKQVQVNKTHEVVYFYNSSCIH